MDISIIIVSYNTKEFIDRCIKSIQKSDFKKIKHEIIVVDNASSDQSEEFIKKNFPTVKLVENKDNLGFAKACNQGVRDSRGKYLLFLNPDAQVNKNTLSYMSSFMEKNKDVGASTCFIKLPSGELDNGAHRGFPTPWNAFSYFSGLNKLFPKSKIFAGYTMGWLNLREQHEVDSIVGAFMMVRRKAGDDIGWWDEDYFFYGEDIDFCYRLKEKNWKIYFVPEVSVFHHKGISGGIKKHSEHISTADLQTKIIATNARFNAMRIFYKKHYREKYPKLLTWLVLLAVEARRKTALKSVQK
ncbi:MAG: glycosyltransferase family 2 protein [Patescibacteria group bacterium]